MSRLTTEWCVVVRAMRFFVASSLVLVSFGLAEAVYATTIDDFQFQGSYGSGPHDAALIVDFSPGNGAVDSFAFRVRFDAATISGFQLLDVVQAGTGGDFSYTTGYGGAFVQSLSYLGHEMVSDYETGMSVMYWTSSNAGDSWNLSWNTLGDTMLGDRETLGWLAQVIDWYPDGKGGYYSDPPESQWSLPVAPLKSVPEPTTLALLVTASLAALARRRRKS